jgi:hypothetical protein
MYGKKHLDTNAHLYAAARAQNDMQLIADDASLSDLQRQLARQCRDLAASLHRSLKESTNG